MAKHAGIHTDNDENGAGASSKHAKLKRAKFEKELEKLHVELVKLQEWVKRTGAKIVILFEGRDAAGKGGVIKRITEWVSPRVSSTTRRDLFARCVVAGGPIPHAERAVRDSR